MWLLTPCNDPSKLQSAAAVICFRQSAHTKTYTITLNCNPTIELSPQSVLSNFVALRPEHPSIRVTLPPVKPGQYGTLPSSFGCRGTHTSSLACRLPWSPHGVRRPASGVRRNGELQWASAPDATRAEIRRQGDRTPVRRRPCVGLAQKNSEVSAGICGRLRDDVLT